MSSYYLHFPSKILCHFRLSYVTVARRTISLRYKQNEFKLQKHNETTIQRLTGVLLN